MLITYQNLLKVHTIPIKFLYKVLAYSVITDVLKSLKYYFAEVQMTQSFSKTNEDGKTQRERQTTQSFGS